ncbi:MAG: phage portal protein, partial [Oscillospiraceae bacterium]|nr:phage portal protein [Oscillospiraceae bacterium]
MNRIIAYGAGTGMTELQFFAKEIGLWKDSPARREQIMGDEYYRGHHDILSRKRTAIGPGGELQEVTNLPNAKIIHNLYAKMVDQKTNYLTGRPLTISCKSDRAQAAISKRFDKRTQRTIKYLTEDALTGGVAWLFVYYDANGNLSFRRFPAYQVLPFWADDEHTRLDAAVRLYPQEVWDGSAKKIVERVEIFKPDGIYRYVYDGTQLIPDVELGERDYYITVDGAGYSWEHFPLIAFKRNKNETP